MLLVLAAVGGVLLDSAIRARLDRRIAINYVADVRAEAAARAGAAQALARLRALQARTTAPSGPVSWGGDDWNRVGMLAGDLVDVVLDAGAQFSVRVEDAASRLPLNNATGAELRNLFVALGAPSDDAEIAARAVLYRRGADGLGRPAGMERDGSHRDLRDPASSREDRFWSLEELRHVPGMDRLYERAAPYLTTGPGARVNLNTASEPVLRALPGLTDEAVALILARRAAGISVRDLFDLEGALSPAGREVLQHQFGELVLRASFEPEAVEIVAVGASGAGGLRRRVELLAVRSGATVHVVRRVQR